MRERLGALRGRGRSPKRAQQRPGILRDQSTGENWVPFSQGREGTGSQGREGTGSQGREVTDEQGREGIGSQGREGRQPKPG